MRTLAILASLVVGWFFTLLVINAVRIVFGVDRSNPDVALAAVAGGVALAVLVAWLVPAKPRR